VVSPEKNGRISPKHIRLLCYKMVFVGLCGGYEKTVL
jgi:hypothetical protein